MKENRVRVLQSILQKPILIKKKENLFYLTGRSFDYRAEEYLLVTKRDVVGFGSGLEQITWVQKSDRLKNIGKYLKGKKLDIEWGFSFGEAKYLKYKIKDSGLKIKVEPKRSPVDEMRQVKDSGELLKISKSMQLVRKVFHLVRKEIRKSGMTEIRLAKFIQSSGLRLGAEDISFPAIVASGANAAIPHHVPISKKLKAGESIIIDFGFKYQNYCSDFTRTVFLKRVPKKLEMTYNMVEKAYKESMVAAKLGVRAGDLYDLSVQVLAEKRLDRYFIHSLGHGTGLEIHELPNLSPGSKDILKDNMVFSIEPGVYLPKVGGIRIEDLVYIKQCKVSKFINVQTNLISNIL
ncbi:MAG: M24 family metallopeptidase [Candidatus Doudnabacteria bacterium]|nr:M24 family metallopeptidase [Candidatus Doudnabacteria bacterium]